MALLTSCLCCNLLLGAIVSGVYVTMVYLLAFIISVWWIVEEEGGGDQGVPAPAYLLCIGYLVVAVASAWMLLGLYKKKTRVLLVWVFLMTLFCFPEMGMVAFMAFIHWKITSPYGLADLIFYVFRAAFNLLSVLCVQSQYSTWRDAATTSNTLKRLQHFHLNSIGKNYVRGDGGGEGEGREVGGGRGGGEVPLAYHNPVFLGNSEVPPPPSRPAAPHLYASLPRSLSRASSLRGWSTESSTAAMSPPIAALQVRTGLPGWDPYINRESQSEFNASTFTPASVGFMPLVGSNLTGARSELSLYPPSPPSSSSPLTVYHHSPPQQLYPLHLPHLPPPLPPPPLPGGDTFSYAAATQSLDRRRYVRRWQGVRAGGGGGGGANGVVTSSRSSLGGESDDFRRYRDVALRRAAVMKVVDMLLEEVKDLSAKLQDPRNPDLPPDHLQVSHIVDILVSLRPTIHHRLYFSPTLQYLYATQLARKSGSAEAPGQSVEMVEVQLAKAQREREVALSSREALVTSLNATLKQLDSQGSQAVLKCRREARVEYEEVRSQSESSLEQLRVSLAASKEAQLDQTQRHSEEEAAMRDRRQELEMEMQQVIHKYDATMSCLQMDLDSLRDDHTCLMTKLEHQTAALSIVERRYRSILEEKQRAEEERLAAMQAEFRREHAARTIQRAWQHYKMRKMLKKAQRKRKKKPKDAKETKK